MTWAAGDGAGLKRLHHQRSPVVDVVLQVDRTSTQTNGQIRWTPNAAATATPRHDHGRNPDAREMVA